MPFWESFSEVFSETGGLGEESARITNPRQRVLKSCWGMTFLEGITGVFFRRKASRLRSR
jgi:hypothetical protein